MSRRAFTLMEMLVSIVILVLITLFMYGAIASSKLTSRTLSKHTAAENNRTMLYDLFYRDIIEAISVEPLPTQNRRFSVVKLQTRNTLYDIAAPHVVWYVNAQSRALVRLESAQPLALPISYEQKPFIHADVFADNVEDFNLYTAMTGGEANVTTDVNASESAGQNDTAKSGKGKTLHFNHFLLYLNKKPDGPTLLEIGL